MAFPPGESPFRARGLVYQAAKDYADQLLPSGLDSLVAALDPPLRTFFNQVFLASAMYDALPLVPISATVARLAKLSHVQLVSENARWTAERDIKGVYKLLLNVLSAETVAVRIPKASMRYFDFGVAEAKMTGDKVCRSSQTGIPREMAEWFTAAAQGFVTIALERAGARMPRVEASPPRIEGVRHGVETVTLEFEYTWA